MFCEYVTLDGYVVVVARETSVGVRKANQPMSTTVIWLPRQACRDGDDLKMHDTDIELRRHLAEEKGLDF